jgi:hypothetical protein
VSATLAAYLEALVEGPYQLMASKAIPEVHCMLEIVIIFFFQISGDLFKLQHVSS